MERVNQIILEDGHTFSGYGYYRGASFIPNGYGMKQFSDMYVKGNFVDGELNGPAIISHDYYMYTMQMKNNRGNGWGMCINGGVLVEFGYYKDSQLVVDLLDAVEWYYDKMAESDRAGENMLHIYTSKIDGSLVDLHIGYSAKDSLASMGFHFLTDGSVWVGTTKNNRPNGSLIKFCSNGFIKIGEFENGNVVEEFGIQELIDNYYGTLNFSEDSIWANIFTSRKSTQQTKREAKRKQFDKIRIDTSINYSLIK